MKTLSCLGISALIVGLVVLAQQPPQPPSCATLTVGSQSVCNTAVVLTRAMDVQSVDHWCKLSSSTSGFVCSTPTPAAWCNSPANIGYAPGTWIDMLANVSTSGPASLNVNNCGLANIKLADGKTDPGTAMLNGSMYHLVSDGTVFRLK